MPAQLFYDGPATLIANQLFTARLRVELGTAMAPGGSCYFLRVRQTDGGTAWSSPVWVEGVSGE